MSGFFSGPADLLNTLAPGWMPQQTRRGTYTRKHLDVSIMLGQGNWGQAGKDTLKLTNLRVSASVIVQGGIGMGNAQLRIWGMTDAQMNRISTLGISRFEGRENNYVLVEAGDDTSPARSIVYNGDIFDAWADFQGQPDVPFHVISTTIVAGKLKPVTATELPGLVDVPAAVQMLVEKQGMQFENNGVTADNTVKVINQVLNGTGPQQLQQLIDAADIAHTIDPQTNPPTYAIWPKNGWRSGPVPLISPRTGMVGYPAFTANGIVVTTVYNPAIRYGAQVKVESQIPGANRIWSVRNLTHTLDAEMPGGNWFTRFECDDPRFAGRTLSTPSHDARIASR
jgi:hypothetical protein